MPEEAWLGWSPEAELGVTLANKRYVGAGRQDVGRGLNQGGAAICVLGSRLSLVAAAAGGGVSCSGTASSRKNKRGRVRSGLLRVNFQVLAHRKDFGSRLEDLSRLNANLLGQN